jgi:hypothetical protein
VFVAASPAHAYRPNPSVYWIVQDADDCTKISGSEPGNMFEWGNYGSCLLQGSHGGRYHGNDPDSRNMLIELWVNRGPMIGAITFRADGELLWVTDTNNDDDTFYVWINGRGPYFAPGTSREDDERQVNLDLADGVLHSIKITDDDAGRDVIASSTDEIPYLIP